MLPNCAYCGKFVNPKNEAIASKLIYGHLGIDDEIYFHNKCFTNKTSATMTKAEQDLVKEFQDEAHQMTEEVMKKTKKVGVSVQDVTNIFIYMKLAEFEMRLRALEDGCKRVKFDDIKF
jgi:hypothetical protein